MPCTCDNALIIMIIILCFDISAQCDILGRWKLNIFLPLNCAHIFVNTDSVNFKIFKIAPRFDFHNLVSRRRSSVWVRHEPSGARILLISIRWVSIIIIQLWTNFVIKQIRLFATVERGAAKSHNSFNNLFCFFVFVRRGRRRRERIFLLHFAYGGDQENSALS